MEFIRVSLPQMDVPCYVGQEAGVFAMAECLQLLGIISKDEIESAIDKNELDFMEDEIGNIFVSCESLFWLLANKNFFKLSAAERLTMLIDEAKVQVQ